MSLDFCCDIQMVGSEFGIKNMKAWIHGIYHAVKNTLQGKEETDNTNRQDRAGYFWYERPQESQLLNLVIFEKIQTTNTVLWLFNDKSLYCLS